MFAAEASGKPGAFPFLPEAMNVCADFLPMGKKTNIRKQSVCLNFPGMEEGTI
jgi:hypothetical protein